MSNKKIGRNHPCPCGSGKKYKKCCGAIRMPQRQQSAPGAQNQTPTITAQIPAVGVPGETQGMIVCNVFKGADPRNIGGPSGTPGMYKVTFLLERPGYGQTKDFTFTTLLRGDSHLAITKPAYSPPGNADPDQIKIYAMTPHGRFEFTGFPNEKGYLGKVVSEPFYATNRNDAEHRAYDALVPSLSNWSIHLDIPLEVQVIETMELRTENAGIRVVQPFLEAPFAVEGTPPGYDSEFAHYAQHV